MSASHSELITVLSTTPLRGRLPTVWEELVRCKRSYYSALSHYDISLALLQLSQSVTSTAQSSRLVHVLMNAHTRVAAGAEHTLRRPVYTDAAIETHHGRLLLGNTAVASCVLCLLIIVVVFDYEFNAQKCWWYVGLYGQLCLLQFCW